jgi:hypothetical protein
VNESKDAPNQSARLTRLRAVRDIGRIALDAVSGSVDLGNCASILGKITELNATLIGDPVLGQTLATRHLSNYAKLFEVSNRAAAVAAEMESEDLPEGWSIKETSWERTYSTSDGDAQVTVNKDSCDPGRLSIWLQGKRVWSSYEGDQAPLMPLSDALHKADVLLKGFSPAPMRGTEAPQSAADDDVSKDIANEAPEQPIELDDESDAPRP